MQKTKVREHLAELRKRLLIVAVFAVFGCSLAVAFWKSIIHILIRPLEGEKLIYTSPQGGFEFIFKVVLYTGTIFAIPVLLYQIMQFVAPALPSKIAKFNIRVFVSSTLLAFTGVVFAYFAAIPTSLRFLSKVGNNYLDSFISTSEYMSFVALFLLGFAIIFQLPLIISIIDKAHPLDPTQLMKKQKHMLVLGFIVAAILTPTPDAMNQTIMALPIATLYQFGVIIVWWRHRSRRTSHSAAPLDQALFAGVPLLAQEQFVASTFSKQPRRMPQGSQDHSTTHRRHKFTAQSQPAQQTQNFGKHVPYKVAKPVASRQANTLRSLDGFVRQQTTKPRFGYDQPLGA